MDRRVKKTQAAIRKAFEELLNEKGDVNSISIKEIVDRADISRSTFYTHYSDILELTDDISRAFAEDITNIIIKNIKNSSEDPTLENAYKEVLFYLHEKGPFSKAVLCDLRNGTMLNSVTDTVRDRISEYYKQTYQYKDESIVRAAVTIWTGGFEAVIRDWAYYDFRFSIDSLAKIISESMIRLLGFFAGER